MGTQVRITAQAETNEKTKAPGLRKRKGKSMQEEEKDGEKLDQHPWNWIAHRSIRLRDGALWLQRLLLPQELREEKDSRLLSLRLAEVV
mmetsp:Transcript_127816/g.238961  ORF Transcript_127816/g.238961 Transcript_127816/m.238961 type:complete len:89 (+) Transcript_127816:185-451(+)